MRHKVMLAVVMITALFSVISRADELRITFFTTATHLPAGYITVIDTKNGLLIKPTLSGLPPGLHGFHLHQNPSCEHNGDAAGSHYDPDKANHHAGPYDTNGHRGDMPALFVDAKGFATLPILAPHLTTRELRNHSIIIHADGDNYSDSPQPNGGGGARFACGIVK